MGGVGEEVGLEAGWRGVVWCGVVGWWWCGVVGGVVVVGGGGVVVDGILWVGG
jgi:hypothetical protein